MVEIRITYETLFDLLRREKNREELQELDADFYEQVFSYLSEKRDTIKKKGDDLFVSAEKEKLKIQFQNIRRIIKELYERREKKIINMALNKARTGSDIIDITPLLPSEKEFFEEQFDLFVKYKDRVLNNIIHLKEMVVNGNNTDGKATEKTKIKQMTKIEQTTEESMPESEEKPASSISSASASNKKKVKILVNLPRFAGMSGEALGPFSQGDEAELDSPIANILVKKGRAEEC